MDITDHFANFLILESSKKSLKKIDQMLESLVTKIKINLECCRLGIRT